MFPTTSSATRRRRAIPVAGLVAWLALAPAAPAQTQQTTSPAEKQAAGGNLPLGTLSEAAWLRWAYLHTDHHLRQFGV